MDPASSLTRACRLGLAAFGTGRSCFRLAALFALVATRFGLVTCRAPTPVATATTATTAASAAAATAAGAFGALGDFQLCTKGGEMSADQLFDIPQQDTVTRLYQRDGDAV